MLLQLASVFFGKAPEKKDLYLDHLGGFNIFIKLFPSKTLFTICGLQPAISHITYFNAFQTLLHKTVYCNRAVDEGTSVHYTDLTNISWNKALTFYSEVVTMTPDDSKNFVKLKYFLGKRTI